MSARLAAARQAWDAGRYDEALAFAREALAAAETVEALVLLVNAATRTGAHDDAVAGLERLLALHPGHAQFGRMLSTAINNATSRRDGDAAHAAASYERAIALWPGNVEALWNRALVAQREGDGLLAATLLGRALELRPDDAALADAAATVAAEANQVDQAIAALPLAQSIPSTLDVAADLAAHGSLDGARVAYARAAALGRRGEIAPSLRGCLGEQLVLQPVPADAAEIARERAAFARGLDALEAELDPARLARCEPRLEQLQWTNFLLAYHGEDDRALQSRYGELVARCAAAFAPALATPPPQRNHRRIAIVSGFLRDTTIGAYFESWVGALVAAGFDVTAFALGPRHDAATDRIAASATRLVKLDGTIESMAQAIRASGPALALYPELGMDTRAFVLAALKLAPLQACAWGHPVTSGLPTIDAYFTCGAMEPPGADAHYRERLLRLPRLGTAYRSPATPTKFERGTLGLPAGRLYLVPQSAFKIHPDNDLVLAEIARRDPLARIVLFDNEHRGATKRLVERLGRAFASRDADASRLVVLPLTARERFLAITAACDVMVDTVRWSGGNTSLDALRCGLPVVTAPGRFMRGRQTAAMLAMLGVDDRLVVPDAATLAARAVEIASDAPGRTALANRIEDGWPGLIDGHEALAALVAHCEDLLGGR